MIVIGLLVWVGIRLGAPAIFYILLGLHVMMKLLAFCSKLVEKI